MDKTTYFYPNKTLRLGNKLIDLTVPAIMGILNVTPDSFYDGGKFISAETAIRQAEKMAKDGADLIDVGGMSSRPGAAIIDSQEEIRRILPILEVLNKELPDMPVSVDTIYSKTAEAAIDHGAAMINDISAGTFDPAIFEIVAKYKIPYILMHMKGVPDSMQQSPVYENVVEEVLQFFLDKCKKLNTAGVHEIMIDPGFGFGKTVEHNYQLVDQIEKLQIIGYPIIAGVSRKSMICKLLKVNPENALNGSTALHAILLMKYVNILRVHDVKEAVEVVKIVRELRKQEK